MVYYYHMGNFDFDETQLKGPGWSCDRKSSNRNARGVFVNYLCCLERARLRAWACYTALHVNLIKDYDN